MYIPLKQFQKKTLFAGDVSINQATGTRWQTKLLDTWQVTEINSPRQESVQWDLITHTILWLTNAICDICWLFLPCTKINITLAKAEGRYAHAQMLPLFLVAIFSLGLVALCSSNFFTFLAI